ncbi:hypothetical protein KAR28_01020 [Candidatus Parcubacteria bacterium]|nr:hypothetical protein [Candidatus Parcubacteria bacterium]
MAKNNLKQNRGSSDGESFLSPFKKIFSQQEAKKEISNDFTSEKKAAADWQLAKKNENETRQDNVVIKDSRDKKPEKKIKANFTIEKAVDIKPKTADENKKPKEKKAVPEKKSNISLSNAKKAIMGTFLSPGGWKSSQIIKTNLIQGEITTIIDWSEKKRFVFYMLLSLIIIIGGFYFALLGWEYKSKHDAAKLGGAIAELEEQIKEAEKTVKEVDDFQQKLKFASGLIDKHIYWTNFFCFLEENIITKAVVLGGFAGGTGGEYAFNIKAGEYIDIFDQVRVLKNNDKVIDARVLAGQQTIATKLKEDEEEISEKEVSFLLNMILKPALFKYGQ